MTAVSGWNGDWHNRLSTDRTGSSPSKGMSYTRQSTLSSTSFHDVLFQAAAESSWKVSQHAQQRLSERGITISTHDFALMEKAARQAEARGAKNAYLVAGGAGLVVNLPSRTVVTALDHREQPIVAQIDSVVFLDKLDRECGDLLTGERPIR
ncbi:flagellar operon protein [Alicyclobacillus hesperidum]|uniref:Flagellar operon protein n=1 Tax=Alicyclobacillus hesperidum TaxID=89784 RepID=A0A1H2SG93_9BACL|nr:hypothetical protein [Alicyclobacillus hesperidum]SDW30656.1 flagellar operon protein [Alicyclobacillus hesperidum]